LSERQATGDNASVVVQCPTCQSKFRIADEKVTDRGVRVRCTSCKNVFQVRKPGASASEPSGPGTTIDLASLGAATLARSGLGGAAKPGAAARPGTGPVKPSTGPVKPSTGPVKPSTGPVKPSTGPLKPSTGPVKPSTGPVKPSTGPVKPSTGPVKPSTGPLRTTARPSTGPVKPATGPVRAAAARPAAPIQTDDGAARRLDVDDLFGMAELTGDSPLSAGLDPAVPPAKAAEAPAMGGLNDLELEIETAHKAMQPGIAVDAPLPPLDPPLPPANGAPEHAGQAALDLPLDDSIDLEEVPASPLEPAPASPKSEPIRRPVTKPQQPARPAEPEIAPARALVSSAFTGLLGAALAIIVVIASALSADGTAGWLGFGPASEVIATGVVSGLYDTAGGKPVFYIRGRIQNRSDKVRGPVRVTAELLADGAAEAKAETIAGAEPTPEEVWSVRSSADVEKLTRTLQSARVNRKLQPGASLPFFAVIPDPPADLDRHRLQIRVDTVEAWTPGAAKAAREK
jgi:predicted Zn finger-like uncharacterized protein